LRLVVAGMDEDPVDPGFEAIVIPQPREASPSKNEGVLQCVLGESGVAQDPERNRVERVADLVHQDGERLSVAPTGPRYEVSIDLDLRSPRPEWPRSPCLTEAILPNVQVRQATPRENATERRFAGMPRIPADDGVRGSLSAPAPAV